MRFIPAVSPVRIQVPLPKKAQPIILRLLFGPLVKRLRHRPFTAVTWVRFPYGSPRRSSSLISGLLLLFYFLFSFPICLQIHSATPTFPLNNDTAVLQTGQLVCPSSIAAPQFLQYTLRPPRLICLVTFLRYTQNTNRCLRFLKYSRFITNITPSTTATVTLPVSRKSTMFSETP